MFCLNANQGLARDLRNVPGYAEPISKLEKAGFLRKEDVFDNWKQFGEFLSKKREEAIKNPQLFSDGEKETLDKICCEFLGRDSFLNSVPNSI